MTTSAPNPQATGQAWWRYGHVWLVIGGPALVVLASFVTLWLAIRTPDPVVAEDYYRRGVEINRTLSDAPTRTGAAWVEGSTMAPAQQARNHAVTPVQAGGKP